MKQAKYLLAIRLSDSVVRTRSGFSPIVFLRNFCDVFTSTLPRRGKVAREARRRRIMDSPVRQETIDLLLREGAREVERQKALLALLEKGGDPSMLAEARDLLRVLEEQFESYCCRLKRRDSATS